MQLAHGRTEVPLIVICSKEVRSEEVTEMAERAKVTAHAIDLPQSNPIGISFATSSDQELIDASPGWNRDLSMKRNLGLVLARMLGWTRLMFLDDDIDHITVADVNALANALDDHNVSALMCNWFPDNSVTYHAHRDGGGIPGVFASANGMGVRCDRADLGFFPNIYNEDWFFFCEEAATHRIAEVGVSHQLDYDPYADASRATREEFGDLLAEGLYERLDRSKGIWDVDKDYWTAFIKTRRSFHDRVEKALARLSGPAKSGQGTQLCPGGASATGTDHS